MSALSPLLQHFSDLEDPRIERTKRHDLDAILTIAICAVICGAEDYVAIEDFGHAKRAFFQQMLDLPHGIPSHDTFGRVFAALDSQAFAEAFAAWVQSLAVEWDSQVVAIDGKSMRRTLDRANEKAAIHLVSAFAQTNRLALGQVQVAEKSNEITAIPALLKRLVLSGCLVSLDAMGCQRAIAGDLVEAGADYLLALKANHGDLHEEVKACFAHLDGAPERAPHHACQQSFDGGHGRVEVRRVHALAADWLSAREDWRGLNSLVRVHSERHLGERLTRETRYYLCSLPAQEVARAAHGIRAHWSIENNLHWSLDVAFGEDQQRMRRGHAAANMALLNKIALNLLSHEKTSKVGIKNRRLRAGWDERYLLRVLTTGLAN